MKTNNNKEVLRIFWNGEDHEGLFTKKIMCLHKGNNSCIFNDFFNDNL